MEKYIIEEGRQHPIGIPIDFVTISNGSNRYWGLTSFKATIYDNNGVEWTTKEVFQAINENGTYYRILVDPNCNLNGYTKIKFKYSVEDNSQADGIYTREGIVDFAEIENHNLSIPMQWNERAYDTYIPNHDQFATKEDLNNINIPDVDLSNYYDKQGTNNKIAEYLTNATREFENVYLNKTDAANKYLAQYSGIRDVPGLVDQMFTDGSLRFGLERHLNEWANGNANIAKKSDLSQVETNKNNIQAMQDSFNDINSALDMILNG